MKNDQIVTMTESFEGHAQQIENGDSAKQPIHNAQKAGCALLNKPYEGIV